MIREWFGGHANTIPYNEWSNLGVFVLHVCGAACGLEDFGVVNDEEDLKERSVWSRCLTTAIVRSIVVQDTYVLWASQGDSGNSRNLDQSQLANQLACLLLIARVNDQSAASRDVSFASLDFRVVTVRVGIFCGDCLLVQDFLILDFFDAWVCHIGWYVCRRG